MTASVAQPSQNTQPVKQSVGFELPVGLWLFLPVLVWIVPYAAKYWNESLYQRWIYGELGAIELLTLVFLVAVVSLGFTLFLKAKQTPLAPYRWLFLLLTLGCFYFAGEEASWGQHLLKWGTPEFWHTVNYQGETNLHNSREVMVPLLGTVNLKLIFSVLPRTLLGYFVLIAGVIIPLLIASGRLAWQPAKNPLHWFWPTLVCLPTAVLATITTYPERIFGVLGYAFPASLDITHSELKECLFALFLLLYLSSLVLRLKPLTHSSSS